MFALPNSPMCKNPPFSPVLPCATRLPTNVAWAFIILMAVPWLFRNELQEQIHSFFSDYRKKRREWRDWRKKKGVYVQREKQKETEGEGASKIDAS